MEVCSLPRTPCNSRFQWREEDQPPAHFCSTQMDSCVDAHLHAYVCVYIYVGTYFCATQMDFCIDERLRAYVYVWIHEYVYAHICVRTFLCMSVNSMHGCIHALMHTVEVMDLCIRVCLHTHTCMYAYAYVTHESTCMYTTTRPWMLINHWINPYIYIYIYIYTHTHIFAHTHTFLIVFCCVYTYEAQQHTCIHRHNDRHSLRRERWDGQLLYNLSQIIQQLQSQVCESIHICIEPKHRQVRP